MAATFKTNPVALKDLLRDCEVGRIRLPDFQRSWVWDEQRIRSLIASVSLSFPVGALMTLDVEGEITRFTHRPIEGGGDVAKVRQLLLDGQQRMTSLYQTCLRQEVVRTRNERNKFQNRWFYLDIKEAIRPEVDREDAIVIVPENRRLPAGGRRTVALDLSRSSDEFKAMMFPLNRVFDWDDWQDGFNAFHAADEVAKDAWRECKAAVVRPFGEYQVPVITLDAATTHAAVCVVFEKVNTGGKALDAFELVTAILAADGVKLREEWMGTKSDPGMQARLAAYGRAAGQDTGVLERVSGTDMLQVIALLSGMAERDDSRVAGILEPGLPAVRAGHAALLDLKAATYRRHRDAAETGFERAARFLRRHHIYRSWDLPYQTQIIPLTAILARFSGPTWESAEVQSRLSRWYWCGIFGELYGSAAESRFTRDVIEVERWIGGGEEPATVREGVIRTGRLRDMRSRLSAAYKGVHALLMAEGATDWRTGQTFEDAIFFDEAVDVHHIFPQAWCKKSGKRWQDFDSIINKTPLGFRTNRILGGDAPSEYLGRIAAEGLDDFLASHLVPPAMLRADNFEGFFVERERRLLALIARVTGQTAAPASAEDEDEDAEDEPVLATSPERFIERDLSQPAS